MTLRLEEPAGKSAGHDGDIFDVAFLPDGSCILSAGWDGKAHIWDAGSGISLEEFQLGDKPLSACTTSPDGKMWMAGTMDGLLTIFDPESRSISTTFLAHTRPISSLVFSPDGKQFASTSWDRNVCLWNVNEQLVGQTLGSHADIASGCKFTPDGKFLISWSYDGTAGIWDVTSKQVVAQLIGHEDRITSGAVSPDARWFLSGARNGEVKLWDLQHGTEVNSIYLGGEVRVASFLLDAFTVLLGDSSGLLTVHQLPDLNIVGELDLSTPIQCASLAPSGSQLVLGNREGRITLVAIDGFDNTPLVITARQSHRIKSNLLEKLLGRSHSLSVYECVCPACRTTFELVNRENPTASCPCCHRFVRICVVTDSEEVTTGSR